MLLGGDGSLRHELESRAETLAPGRVKFAGFRQPRELPSFDASADAFCLFSRQEPFGAVLAEALAAGLPVISSRAAGATVDLVDDGLDGRIIDPRATGECVRVLAQLAADSDLRRRMGVASRERARACSVEAAADAILAAIGAGCPSDPPACAEAECS